eukprot:TRINITY_DN5053_c0_g1_i1.p1 TRINITY_DN5053_c0_g1~~TRINITY_DN5053_c0_g1_i1.p1  ORF type:complete len:1348 (+),score=245.05 TRINITY_DN5053_c0_g1_i1:52-4095(+)
MSSYNPQQRRASIDRGFRLRSGSVGSGNLMPEGSSPSRLHPSEFLTEVATLQHLKRLITKMNSGISRSTGVIERFASGGMTPTQFVESMEDIKSNSLRKFFSDWIYLLGFVSEEDSRDIKTAPRENPDRERRTSFKTSPIPENRDQMLSEEDMPSKPQRSAASKKGSSSKSYMQTLGSRKKKMTRKSGMTSKTPQSNDATNTSDAPPKPQLRIRIREQQPYQPAPRVHLTSFKTNTSEGAAALAPYVSDYIRRKSLPTNLSSIELNDLKPFFPTKSTTTTNTPTKEQPSLSSSPRSYVLQAITSLSFATENRFQASPEATQRLLESLNRDRRFDLDWMLQTWETMSLEQQKSWIRVIMNQFKIVSSAVARFSGVKEDLNYEDALKQVVTALKEVSDSYHVTIFQIVTNPKNGSRKLAVLTSTRTYDPNIRTPLGMGLVGTVASENSMIYVDDARCDPRFVPSIDGDVPLGSGLLCVPVSLHAHTRVADWVVAFCGDSFAAETITLLETLSCHVAISLSNIKSRSQQAYLRRKFQAMVEISHILSSELELEPLIRLMRQTSKDLLEADKCTLFLVIPEKRELWTKLEEGPEISFPMSSGISGYVASTGDTVNIPDAYKDSRFCSDVDTDTGYRTRSILCMPVKDGNGEIIGAIQMINKSSGPFNEEDEELLHAFCTHAAVAIRNSRIYKQKQEEREKFQALAQIMDVISSEHDLDPLVPILRLKSRELLDADKCTLFIVDEENKSMRTRLAEGMDVSFPMSQGIAGYVASTGETLNIPDAYADPRFNRKFDTETGYCTRNILCMPVRSSDDGAVVGSIQMINKRRGQFNKADEELLKAFAAHAAVAITNSKLYSEVKNTKRTLESILSSINSFVITFNMDGVLTSYNRPFGHIFDVAESTLRSTPFWNVLNGPKEDRLVADMKSIYTSSKSITNKSHTIHSSSGRIFAVDYTVTQLFDHEADANSTWGNRKRAGILLIMDDITDIQSMKKTISSMEDEIDRLRNDVSSAFEAPIQVVVKTIQKISTGDLPLADTRKELVRCLTLLSKTDIFQPDIEKMLFGVDPITRSFILQRFELPQDPSERPSTPIWPDYSIGEPQQDMTLLSWDFDYASIPEDAVLTHMFNIFQHFHMLEVYNIPENKLRNFLMACRVCYRKNPFHNFHHAFSVLHSVYMILVKTRASQYLCNIDILALIVAAICHDLDHPGVNNSFEINTKSPLAMMYNDISVQENHHASTGFSLISQMENNILENMQPEEYKEFRKIVVTAILATDMTQHFELTTKFKNAIGTSRFSRESKEMRQLLVSVILHTADLSNPVRPTPISVSWSERLRLEFLHQVSCNIHYDILGT